MCTQLFLWGTSEPLRAQERFTEQYNITYITMNDGLPHHFIDDLYKDSRGFLWVSTAGGGLSRYDGYEFVHFNTGSGGCKLRSNFIRNVCEDRFQRLWAVSEGGTDIIDLRTLQSVIPQDPKGMLPHLLRQPANRVVVDSRGVIWLHTGNTLHRIAFDAKGEVGTLTSLSPVEVVGPEIILKDIDEDGSVWTCMQNRLCRIVYTEEGKLEPDFLSDALTFEAGTSCTDILAKENELWIATDRGLLRYNRTGNMVKHYAHDSGNPHSLSQNFLTGLAVSKDKQLLVATLRGVNIYNPITDSFERFMHEESATEGNTLSSNFVNCILAEDDHIWFGTETGGINQLTPRRLSARNYRHNREKPASLSPNPVNAIYEDKYGNLWVGTVEGGLNRKLPQDEGFAHYTRERGELTHNSVSAITADSQDRLWVGTWGGGINLLDMKAPHRRKEVINAQTAEGYPIDFVGTLTYDSINHGMWIGANQGIYFYDLHTRQIRTPFANRASENIHGCIGSIIDNEQQLWIGCMEGAYVIDLHSRTPLEEGGTFRYRHLRHKLDNPQSHLTEKITCFYQAEDGTLWLGSNGYGIYRRTIDEEGKERFVSYSTAQGLPNNSVRGIVADKHGHAIWISTNNGLSCFYPKEERFVNYTRQDGLPDMQFYWNASFRSPDNVLYFGSVAGLTAVESNRPQAAAPAVRVRFTRLLIGNQEIMPGHKYLPFDIAVTDKLRLHEREKSFSLEFSALNFTPNITDRYSYRLLGFEEKWVQVSGNRRFASYTNLRPGKYTLQVKYAPDGGSDDEHITQLEIEIRPYFYKTTWFVLLLILLAGVAVRQFYLWRIRNYTRQKELLRHTVEERTQELEQQKTLLEAQTEELSWQNNTLIQQNEKITRQKQQLSRMARKVQELTLDKISFFTNITHEFRTPITLIIGPIERALKLSSNPQVIEQLNFVERNSKYLLSLVNQLMDFRKIEAGKLDIARSKGDFPRFVHSLLTPFEVYASERNIRLNHRIRMPEPCIRFDEEAMHKVITNLLSNAIKFTPDGGEVTLYAATLHTDKHPEGALYLSVSDTGTGIPEQELSWIFNRFYQSKTQIKYPVYGQAGTGIGLYLCKRIVQMHGGEISARNNRAKGCSFRILLPLAGEEQPDDHLIVENNAPCTAAEMPDEEAPKEKTSLTILVVEDNADMRSYIRSILRDYYRVLEAENGAEALRILNAQPVDFVVSDLMMPVMDGIELSRRVKETFAISHIPFLMLTAKTSPESRIESYRIGVDEYLLKPFDETLLLTRIENILENRRRYQRSFRQEMNADTLHIAEESGDKKFIEQVMQIIKEHYKNPYFEVSDFSEAMGLSKSMLNRKLQSLIGQSAGQFIRNYRLNTARELILQNRKSRRMNITEVAYEVGFNDPKYFTRCFTKQFDISPRAFMNEEEEK